MGRVLGINDQATYKLAFRLDSSPAIAKPNLTRDKWVPLDIESLLSLERAGVRPHVPDLFYDVEEYNRISFIILRYLREAFDECAALLAGRGESKYLNLVAIFFQELQRILCAYVFKVRELEHLSRDLGVEEQIGQFAEANGMPYVDYDFAMDPEMTVSPTISSTSTPSLNLREFVKALIQAGTSLRNAFHSGRTYRLACTGNLGVDVRSVARSLNEMSPANWWDVRVLKSGQAGVWVPRLDDQEAVLSEAIGRLSDDLDITIPDSLEQVISDWMRSHLTQKVSNSYRPDVLLSGSLMNPGARTAAAWAKSHGIPVVSVFHGDSCGVQDEPLFGYGENTFTDVVIGYGERGCDLAVANGFSSSLFGDGVRYVPSQSSKVREIFSSAPIPVLADVESPRFMYVPTSLTGSGRYGPFRDMHDVAYLTWQRALIRSASARFPGRITWKRHVKEKIKAQLDDVVDVEAVDKPFEHVLHKADAFIFDYVSSAFSQAAATSKPIVYMDIGLRNISPDALKAIEERCIYVRADPKHADDAVENALAMMRKACVNRFTPQFSMARDARPRHQVIAEAIHRVAAESVDQTGHD